MKVAIIGTGNGAHEAPWTDPTYERWGLNDGYHQMPEGGTASCWFELHGDTPLTRARRTADHWDALAQLNVPVYTFHDLPTVPLAERFPLERILGAGYRDYFACTAAYQIAFALLLGASHIALYGQHFTFGREVVVEAKCVEWWLGFAEGRGVKVSVWHPYEFGLMRHAYRYAADDLAERQYTYRLCQTTSEILQLWLPAEAERVGLVESVKA